MKNAWKLEKPPIDRGVLGGAGIDQDGSERIRKPLLYPTELRDQNENFVGFFGCWFPFVERRSV
jgi:hypothetical protein